MGAPEAMDSTNTRILRHPEKPDHSSRGGRGGQLRYANQSDSELSA